MSDIRPIDLPTAAGIDYGEGDVRHFSEGDAMGVPGLQNPTRMLAERDNKLAAKMNEVVSVVNNKEQVVTLPIPRTAIPPTTEEVVFNFAIPDGYEARILSAAVGSSPTTNDLTLKVYYSTGFGNTTGTELVSTTSTFSSGVAFYNTGELIVAILNDGSASLDAVSSIVLTVRPIGSTASLLVGSVIRGPRGYTGSKGDDGGKGDPGVGGAGTPGLSWTGTFSDAASYNPPQAVYYTRENGAIEAYISTAGNSAPAFHPTDPAYWDPLAAGAAASLTWRGAWVALTAYFVNDAVSYNGSSYICTANVSDSVTPDNLVAWDLLAAGGSSSGVTIGTDSIDFAIDDGGGLASTTTQGDYDQIIVGSLPTTLQADEFAVVLPSGSPDNLAFMKIDGRYVFVGTLSVTMPTSSFTGVQYTQGDVVVTAVAQGDQDVPFPSAAGTHAGGVRVDWPSTTQVDIIVTETVGEQKVHISAIGIQAG